VVVDPDRGHANTGIPFGVDAVQGGDIPSFAEFHHSREADAIRYARSIVGPDGAEDACQEAWLRAWRNWGAADPARLDAWFFRIVRNASIDLVRRGRRRHAALDEQRAAGDVELEEAVASRVDAAGLAPVLDRLPPALREVLWLREVMDMTYAEIADFQQVPNGTVMSRLHSARKKAGKLLRGSADVSGPVARMRS
jgi:RNA polymerase sigma factor (sigma-70 family)